MVFIIIWLCLSLLSSGLYYILYRKKGFSISRYLLLLLLPFLAIFMEIFDRLLSSEIESIDLSEDELDVYAMSALASSDKKSSPFISAVGKEMVSQRRDMMKKAVLSPDSYLDVLNLARSDEDTEVVHYATTALVKMREQAEELIVRTGQQWRKNQGDSACKEEYRNALEHWLACDFPGEQRNKKIKDELAMLQK